VSYTKVQRKHLFRITKKRQSLLEFLITILNVSIEGRAPDSCHRKLIETNKAFEEDREKRLKEFDDEHEALCLIQDVFMTIVWHEDDSLIDWHSNKKRGWKNEWEIPIEYFNWAIESEIKHMKRLRKVTPKNLTTRHKEVIHLLQKLKEVRNETEQNITPS